jgi:hypothetical protein
MLDYVPDARFPTNNQYDIPSLDINFCAQYCDLPFIGWGTQRRSDKMPGTWHFYVDDYRFNALWQHPEKVTQTGCRSLVEPNFSVYQQTPQALSIWQVYRKRWLARYWQSKGILIFADLNVNRDYQWINTMGIPNGWTAFSTRGYGDRWKDTLREHQVAGEIASDNVKHLLFVVYGGGKSVKQLCGDHGFVWIPEQEDEK